MIKKALEHLDLDVYSETLENGLSVYVVPNHKVNNIHVTFSTNYGSIQNEFVPLGEKKMITVPAGIAHFLEHKLFEQPDGVDPFTFFTERGCDANANTSNYKTTYLFTGTDFLEENINYLLDYVQTPYFTDENVQKEKGIIEQEIKMYLDDSDTQLIEKALASSFVEHPIRIPVIGSVKSVNSITKDDLYTCYHTFYHPSNMFLTITGNVDPQEILNIVKENQSKKEFEKAQDIKLKQYQEPDAVKEEKCVISMNVAMPKVAFSYKFNIGKLKGFGLRKILLYLSLLFDCKLGPTSAFTERMKKEGILTQAIDSDYANTDSHVLYLLAVETKFPDILVEKIKEEMQQFDISEEELERKKKSLIGSTLFISDNVIGINHKIMNNLIQYHKILYDDYHEFQSLSLKELKSLYESLTFDHTNTIIIEPKDAK